MYPTSSSEQRGKTMCTAFWATDDLVYLLCNEVGLQATSGPPLPLTSTQLSLSDVASVARISKFISASATRVLYRNVRIATHHFIDHRLEDCLVPIRALHVRAHLVLSLQLDTVPDSLGGSHADQERTPLLRAVGHQDSCFIQLLSLVLPRMFNLHSFA